MKTMNVVFIGASKFGFQCLETILSFENVHLKGVVTAPQKFSISYNKSGVTNVLYEDIASFCEGQSIPCATIKNGMKDEGLFNEVEKWEPDLFIVAGWYHMVPKKWRELAPAYGLHASLLPDYSGGAPLVWAIINGEKETGITFFQFADGVDNGPIVAQKRTEIAPRDTIKSLYDRIEVLGVELIKENLLPLLEGSADLKTQNEENRRVFPQRSPDDGKIDLEMSAEQIYNFVRAQTKPYPGAFLKIDGKLVRIWAAEIVDVDLESNGNSPLIENDNDLFLVAGDKKFLHLKEYDYE